MKSMRPIERQSTNSSNRPLLLSNSNNSSAEMPEIVGMLTNLKVSSAQSRSKRV